MGLLAPLHYFCHEICHSALDLWGYGVAQVKRLAWAGHLVRMNNDRTLKEILYTKPDGARSAGRPKLRWEDGFDEDMRILGVKNWKKVALSRDECAQLLKKAKAHQGLSSQ